MENEYTNNSKMNQREFDLLLKPRRVKIQVGKGVLNNAFQGEVGHLMEIVVEHVCILFYIHMLKMSKMQSCVETEKFSKGTSPVLRKRSITYHTVETYCYSSCKIRIGLSFSSYSFLHALYRIIQVDSVIDSCLAKSNFGPRNAFKMSL